MTILILDMPDDPKNLPAWIEDQLVGTSLGTVVAELATIHKQEDAKPELDEVLDGCRDAVLDQGLSVLLQQQCRSLLTHPSLLLELQELVACEGKEFWRDRAAGIEETQQQVDLAWARLSRDINIIATTSPAIRSDAARRRGPWNVVGLAIAIAVLLLVGIASWQLGSRSIVEPKSWGWQSDDTIDHDLAAPAYLQKLADSGNQWFNKRPTDAKSLAQRIGQFRSGCSRLILAEHRPLVAADQKWLVERCQSWAEKLNRHLSDIESGRPVDDVRSEVDDTVSRLVAAIRKRADTIERGAKTKV